jgi:hypothetical protein
MRDAEMPRQVLYCDIAVLPRLYCDMAVLQGPYCDMAALQRLYCDIAVFHNGCVIKGAGP